jgi:hypothetical protein
MSTSRKTSEVSPTMLTSYLLTVLIEDREREIRKHLPRVPGIPSGPRHPAPEPAARLWADAQPRPAATSDIESP